jgi:hypothetical protein
MEVFLEFFNRLNGGNKKKSKSPEFQFFIFNVLAKNIEGGLIICASHSWSITRLG